MILIQTIGGYCYSAEKELRRFTLGQSVATGAKESIWVRVKIAKFIETQQDLVLDGWGR